MTVRLRWNQAGFDRGGAFVLRDAPLFLLVSASGELDRLHQDPETRVGFVAEDSGQGGIKLAGRGGLGFLVDGKIRDHAEIAFGADLICSFEDQQWTLQAEGEGSLADPLAGTELGGYRILERLGNGSVGVVYRALQINLEREVALKILDPKAAKKSPLAVASFKREAVAAGRLSHPNLVQVYDVGFERGLHFFAMELVSGGDLELLLEQGGPLPWRQALMHVLDCAEALRFARQHHLVHRDVKPENLMLTVDGRTKLADLGMAATRGMVETKAAGGTPHFMAPECVSGEHIDFRSDFYSLGCTLFRLLSGETPFDGDSVRDILRGHRDDPTPSLKDHDIDAPAGVQDLVAWLMAKNPDARPADADELIEEINALLDTKKSNGLLIGVVAVVVIAAGASLYSTLSSTDEPTYVEIESPAAQQERERSARLEAELAFTQAMAVAEGEQRVLALQKFLGMYSSSAFHFQALDEIERLGSLPIAEVEDISQADREAAEAQAATSRELAHLESSLQVLLEQHLFGQAQTVLAGSPLSAALLAPLWSRVESISSPAFAAWQQQHADFLAAEEWQQASAVRERFTAAIEGLIHDQESRQAQLVELHLALATAQQDALQRDFDQTRQVVVLALQEQVLVAVEKMDFQAAQVALQQVGTACKHPELSAALLARASLFAEAQQVMDAIYAVLDGDAHLDIIEPVDGKRAFATKADASGVQLMVQVRGERVPRTDPWSAFVDPQVLPNFLEQVLGPNPDGNHARFSLQLLLAEASLARELSAWGKTPPSSAAAAQTAAVIQGWLASLDGGAAIPSEVWQAELFALQQLLDLSESLVDSDSYEALLHARGMGMEFSLLSAWSSNGVASWGFTP